MYVYMSRLDFSLLLSLYFLLVVVAVVVIIVHSSIDAICCDY